MNISRMLLVMAVAFATGCAKEPESRGAVELRDEARLAERLKSFKVAVGTPEEALKTYWRYLDVMAEARVEWAKDYARSWKPGPWEGIKGEFMVGEVLANRVAKRPGWSEPKYAREIADVKLETDSRAIITARIRNITPAPEGAVATAEDAKRREEGERFRYVVERGAAGWCVSQLFKFDRWAEGGDRWVGVWAREAPAVPSYVNDWEQ